MTWSKYRIRVKIRILTLTKFESSYCVKIVSMLFLFPLFSRVLEKMNSGRDYEVYTLRDKNNIPNYSYKHCLLFR